MYLDNITEVGVMLKLFRNRVGPFKRIEGLMKHVKKITPPHSPMLQHLENPFFVGDAVATLVKDGQRFCSRCLNVGYRPPPISWLEHFTPTDREYCGECFMNVNEAGGEQHFYTHSAIFRVEEVAKLNIDFELKSIVMSRIHKKRYVGPKFSWFYYCMADLVFGDNDLNQEEARKNMNAELVGRNKRFIKAIKMVEIKKIQPASLFDGISPDRKRKLRIRQPQVLTQ